MSLLLQLALLCRLAQQQRASLAFGTHFLMLGWGLIPDKSCRFVPPLLVPILFSFFFGKHTAFSGRFIVQK
jgi:hypothetical protein